jgi:hypothetical protein
MNKSLDFTKRPFPLPIFAKGTKVRVYLGAGFGTGYVIESFQDRCSVKLTTKDLPITVYDARCIQRHDKG